MPLTKKGDLAIRSVMELTDEQKQVVRSWVDEGLGLSEIQKKMAKEFGASMTYMDVRFLVLDLGLEVKDKEHTETVDLAVASAPAQGPGPAPDGGLAAGAPAGAGDVASSVSVEIDRVTKPGSVVSGTVVFSDGTRATWFLDQLGRLSLDAKQPNYQPPEADLQSFQLELRKALENRGF